MAARIAAENRPTTVSRLAPQSGHPPPAAQPPSSLCRPRWLLGLRLTLSYGYWSRKCGLRCWHRLSGFQHAQHPLLHGDDPFTFAGHRLRHRKPGPQFRVLSVQVLQLDQLGRQWVRLRSFPWSQTCGNQVSDRDQPSAIRVLPRMGEGTTKQPPLDGGLAALGLGHGLFDRQLTGVTRGGHGVNDQSVSSRSPAFAQRVGQTMNLGQPLTNLNLTPQSPWLRGAAERSPDDYEFLGSPRKRRRDSLQRTWRPW